MSRYPIVLLLLTSLLALSSGATAEQCEAIFVDGAQNNTTGGSGNDELRLDDDVVITGGGNSLPTQDLNADSSASCSGGPCSASGVVAASMTMTILAGSSNTNLDTNSTTSAPQGDYRDVRVRNDDTFTFTANGGVTLLRDLEVDSDATLILTPGDYWIERDFIVDDDSQIVLSGNGVVRIFVGDDIDFEENVTTNGFASSQLLMYASDDININDESTISGYLYAVDNVDIQDDTLITGAISGQNVRLRDDVRINFPAETLDFGDFCDNTPPPPTTIPSPRADWRMDELSWNGTSGEVEDSTSNNFDGTAFSMTTTTGFICNAGDFSANGTSDYLSMSRDALNGLTDFTISAWVQTTNTSSQGIISGSSGSQHNEIIMWWHNQNQFRPYLKGSSSGGNISANINNGNWRHVVWTRNGSNNCLYVDGVLQSCVTRSSAALSIAVGGLIIGQEQDSLGGGFSSSQDWEGLIDEMLIFDSALSQAQVTLLHTRQNAGQDWDGNTRSCPSIDPVAVAEWRFDETAWGNIANEVADSSGNNYHGRAVNTSPTPGLLCNAADLSANSNSDYLTVNANAMNGLSDFTISVWGRTSQSTTFATILSGAAGNSGLLANELYMLFDGNDEFRPGLSEEFFNGTPSISTINITDDQWHHYVWTRRAATRQSCLYMDGALIGCITNPDSDDADPLSIATGGLIIGQDQDSIGGSFDSAQDWQGLLDEMVIFNSVLSASQISDIHSNQLAGNNWDGTARSCPVSGPDHYSITAANGVACETISVTVSAHDSAHGLVDAQGATVTLTTSTGLGTWSGTGVTDATPGDGIATLNFAALGAGATQTTDLELSYPSINTADGSADSDSVTISVSDGAISNTSGSAIAADNPTGTVSLSGFRFGTGNDATFSTVMPNQVAGVGNSSVRLQAIRTNTDTNECEALYPNQTRTVGLAATYRNPTTSGGISPTINSTAVASYSDGAAITGYTNVSLAFDSESIAILTFNYNDVGQLMLHALDSSTAGTATARGSSTDFVVRPHHFAITVSGNPGTTGSGSGFISAASPFSATVVARNAGGTLTPNYGNENAAENVALSFNSLVFPIGGSTGAFTNTSFTGGNGIFNGSNLSWSEVGTITLIADVADGDYLGTGAGAASPTPSGNVGRFYPEDFVLTGATTQNSCDPGGFSYLSQPNISVTYTLTARNADGGTTTNYETDSDGIVITANYPVGSVNHSALQGATDVSSRLTIASTDWVDGAYDLDTTTAMISRSAGLETPFTAVQLSVAVDDSPDPGTISGSNTIGSTLELRFGRATISSAHGPESTLLNVPFGTEYWDGTRFITNTDDSCTAMALTDIRFDGNAIDTPANRTITLGGGTTTGTLFITGADATTTGGTFGLMFSPPGAGNTGNFPVNVDLTNYSWLRSDWNQDGNHNNDSSLPEATIRFEHYRGHDRIIYWRERFD